MAWGPQISPDLIFELISHESARPTDASAQEKGVLADVAACVGSAATVAQLMWAICRSMVEKGRVVTVTLTNALGGDTRVIRSLADCDAAQQALTDPDSASADIALEAEA